MTIINFQNRANTAYPPGFHTGRNTFTAQHILHKWILRASSFERGLELQTFDWDQEEFALTRIFLASVF